VIIFAIPPISSAKYLLWMYSCLSVPSIIRFKKSSWVCFYLLLHPFRPQNIFCGCILAFRSHPFSLRNTSYGCIPAFRSHPFPLRNTSYGCTHLNCSFPATESRSVCSD
jgi:hypothetical protein